MRPRNFGSVYLEPQELDELLADVKGAAKHPFIYPMFVFCGHTGAGDRKWPGLRWRNWTFATVS